MYVLVNTDNKNREIFVKFLYHPPLRNQTTILCHAQYRRQPAQVGWGGAGLEPETAVSELP
jgi:hypothetical protein